MKTSFLAFLALVGLSTFAGSRQLVLCVGGDWCVSGEDVRKVYESAAFRSAVGSGWQFGVRDQREMPGDSAVTNANNAVKHLDTGTSRYPALFVFNGEGGRVARFENLPRDVTAAQLAKMVRGAETVRTKAEAMFAQGLRGEGFELLLGQEPSLFRHQRNKGWTTCAYQKEWEAMKSADPQDKTGWQLRFTMGDGLGDVAKADGFKDKPEEGAAFIAELRRRPLEHLTVEQRQSINMAEFALLRRDAAKKERCLELLHQVREAGAKTFWGWAAHGWLKDFGETLENAPYADRAHTVPYGRGLVDLRVKGVERALKPAKPGAAARLMASERQLLTRALGGRSSVLSAREELAVARVWLLHEVGTNVFDSVLAQEGGRDFAKRLLGDREWLEELLASGPMPHPAVAFTNLAAFVRNDDGWMKSMVGRRAATAIALNSDPKRSQDDLVRTVAGYRFLERAGRLHRAALTQTVREWRFAVGRVLAIEDLLFLNDFFNYPLESYSGAAWAVPYRLFNCFGESVQTPKYYRPWNGSDWAGQALRPRVGGVCGALSTFGALSANAHGLMATTGGQPGHCAYMRRRANGTWDINNYVSRFTSAHNTFWGHPFTYLDVIERSFADRASQLRAERMLWLARLLEDEAGDRYAVESLYRMAAKACPAHFGVWRAYCDWLKRSKAPPERVRAYMLALARSLPNGRQAVWDLENECAEYLSATVDKAKKSAGAGAWGEALASLERVHALLPQPTNTPVREEMDYSGLLRRQMKLAGNNDASRSRLFRAALNSSAGRPSFAEVLGWGAEWYMQDATRAKEFIRIVESVASAKKGTKLDFRGMMLSASKAGDIAVFRSVADLQSRLEPLPAKTERYPEHDFGGSLLSAKGMLKTSSTCGWDHPQTYARVIDASKGTGAAFHTNREKSPWAIVELPGEGAITGVLLENRSGQNRHRQVPFTVSVSSDGKTWTEVSRQEAVQDVYRVPISGRPRARYVKVARESEAKNEYFHLGKILVYGQRLW